MWLAKSLPFNLLSTMVQFDHLLIIQPPATDLGLDSRSIDLGDDLLKGTGEEDITVFKHQVLTLVLFGVREALNGAVLLDERAWGKYSIDFSN